jgi:hypothetical protein
MVQGFLAEGFLTDQMPQVDNVFEFLSAARKALKPQGIGA